MNIDIHAIVRPRVGKHAGRYGLVEGITLCGRFVVTVPIQGDEVNMRICRVELLPEELFLVGNGRTIDRWNREEKSGYIRCSVQLPKTIDPYDGLELEEMPTDPILRKRLQERIATRRRLRAMTKQQLAEYYERRKKSRNYSKKRKALQINASVIGAGHDSQ
jgi:hypothetical protein